jgi:hypothetical protein
LITSFEIYFQAKETELPISPASMPRQLQAACIYLIQNPILHELSLQINDVLKVLRIANQNGLEAGKLSANAGFLAVALTHAQAQI